MRNFVLLFVLCLIAASCSSSQRNDYKEKVVDALSSKGSEVIAEQLDCKRPDLIKSDLAAKLSEIEFLQPEEQKESFVGGLVSEKVCLLAVNAVLPGVIGVGLDQLPSNWECSGDPAKVKLSELAKLGCARLRAQ